MILTRDDVKSLLRRLNSHLSLALEAAVGFSLGRTHYEVFPDHLLIKLLEQGTGDIPLILNHFDIDSDSVLQTLNRKLERFVGGNTEAPKPSRELMELFEASWMVSSIQFDQSEVRSGFFLLPYLDDQRFTRSPFGTLIEHVETKTLRKDFFQIVSISSENVLPSSTRATPSQLETPGKAGEGALDLYTINITAKAKAGEIDPVYGRDREILQVIDILSRRKKNNPILVGEAGVGKTAVVEGLALRFSAGDIPHSLADTEIRNLDLGLLQAGASVKGEFESRLKGVINQVLASAGQIVLFIDEAHTLIGAGGAAGVGDAANLLKPALARGQLRTIGATTWSEYKKYIERDPALERRFQMVKIDEPEEDTAIVMIRGIKSIYERHHKVSITDSAVKASVTLSKRYIAGRQLPDKAVDLLDTAASRVKMTAAGKPACLELLERQKVYVSQRLESLNCDAANGYPVDQKEVEATQDDLSKIEKNIEALEEHWQAQRVVADKIEVLKQQLQLEQTTSPDGGDGQRTSTADDLARLREDLAELQKEGPLVLAEVDAAVVASVVSDWTGIPIGRMVKDQAEALLDFEKIVGQKIVGQDHALKEIADGIRVTKSGMGKQDGPIGVFLFVGPSGVGKSETARWTAEILFGGEKFMTVINMSEYQEKHTVSQLKGSPPGYVGYGEGGVLTEALRRRPYSVVLLDEVEKADREVMSLFYQVFDKGFMRDGEGREIDFKNSIIMMTSNLGSDIMMQSLQTGKRPDPEQMVELIRPTLTRHFQAALLARMKIIPFFPLDKEAISKIVNLKIGCLGDRLRDSHRIALDCESSVVDAIAEKCVVGDMGARYVDYVLDRTLLPDISRALVARLSEGKAPDRLRLLRTEDSAITFEFSGDA